MTILVTCIDMALHSRLIINRKKSSEVPNSLEVSIICRNLSLFCNFLAFFTLRFVTVHSRWPPKSLATGAEPSRAMHAMDMLVQVVLAHTLLSTNSLVFKQMLTINTFKCVRPLVSFTSPFGGI